MQLFPFVIEVEPNELAGARHFALLHAAIHSSDNSEPSSRRELFAVGSGAKTCQVSCKLLPVPIANISTKVKPASSSMFIGSFPQLDAKMKSTMFDATRK